MHFVGIDLAWGERAASGLAVLDETGALVHLSRATTDDTIAEAVGEYLRGDCIVGIDAPLVVVNATGNRRCEAALNRDFARFDAGTHPANTGKPEFSAGPRGGRLAARFGLSVDPSAPGRRALEVYPHAALVALFGLGRILKYKQRTGRPFALVHAETLRLVGLLESLADADPQLLLDGNAEWEALVANVTAATRKSELRRAEDQVDSVVCAYVAMLAVRRPEALTTYGDLETGVIVTPTLPAGLTPTPRGPRVSASGSPVEPSHPEPPPSPGADYAELRPRVEEAARRLAGWLTGALDDAGINYLDVSWRAKRVESFAAKAAKASAGVPLFPDPLRDITDQIGVRVITYVTSDVAAVARLIGDQLQVVDDKDLGRETASAGRFGYVSRHLQVELDAAWLGDLPVGALAVPSAQIQIRTVLQHAWAEFEHDIRYKGTIPEALAPDLDRRFTLAAGLLELADREFEVIRERLRAELTDEPPATDAGAPRISGPELAAFLAGHYPDAGWSRTDHYAWMAGLLLELGIASLQDLAGLLSAVDYSAIAERMGYRHPPAAVRRLDDALLTTFADRYIGLDGNAHRIDPLVARLGKLRGDGAL